ncbi:hypothetical protein, partial [Streptomyces violaceoruber]|uniref:hypothetical protein n=1 Tax=Streptomyces violaceoruber TaxID=1935 RepID=UPI001F437749
MDGVHPRPVAITPEGIRRYVNEPGTAEQIGPGRAEASGRRESGIPFAAVATKQRKTTAGEGGEDAV